MNQCNLTVGEQWQPVQDKAVLFYRAFSVLFDKALFPSDLLATLTAFLPCGGKIELKDDGSAQTITSDNHPSNYPNNQLCKWWIQVR